MRIHIQYSPVMDMIELLDDLERVHIEQADIALGRAGDDVSRASLHDFHILVRRNLSNPSVNSCTHTHHDSNAPPSPQSLSPG